MKYLLDVNVLVAWGWQTHEFHHPVANWIERIQTTGTGHQVFTSPITELGFVRVSMQISRGKVSCQQAGQVLKNMLASLGTKHGFLVDNTNSYEWPKWCKGAAQTTDAHLQMLSESHGVVLATLDKRIPSAYIIEKLQG
jgi:predicted nucleic acid-binding protein